MSSTLYVKLKTEVRANESLGLINTQLQQVQTTLVAAAQETATRDEIAADRQAAQDAQVQQFLTGADQPLTGYQRY